VLEVHTQNIEALMQEQAAIAAIGVFSLPAALRVFRRLFRADPEWMTARDLANAVGIPEAAVAEHLDRLEQASLTCSRDDGTTVDYAVDYHGTSELWGFLMANCFQGNPDFNDPGRAVACG
jgi:DNA-binding transcriptional ArsR family regulator